jgi:hypothetical protein
MGLKSKKGTNAIAGGWTSQGLHNGEGDAMWHGTPLKLWVTDGPNGSGKTVFTLTVSAS